VTVDAVMTRDCKTVGSDMLAESALNVMMEHRINSLLVVDDGDRLIGALNFQDLLRAGVL
ncbi:MAG: CBS domain-containing protein, partial [Gammaproteobacteria bacterium]|nr:CBS domain-containing protein [Gammaproteobacteria bacterium]